MRSDKTMRVLGAVLAAVFLFAACDNDNDNDNGNDGASGDATVEASETPAVAVTASPGQYSSEAVLAEIETEGGDFLNVFFVSESPEGPEAFEALQACTEEFGDDYPRVVCYAFSSIEAFEAAGVDPDTAEMSKECWSSFLGQDRSGDGRGEVSNPDYESEGCPA